MESNFFKGSDYAFYPVSLGIYILFLMQYMVLYDYINGWNCNIYFETKYHDEKIYEKLSDPIDSWRSSATIKFDGRRWMKLTYDKDIETIYCKLNDRNMDYSYHEFKEMNDSAQNLLRPFHVTEYLELDHGLMKIKVEKYTLLKWFMFRG